MSSPGIEPVTSLTESRRDSNLSATDRTHPSCFLLCGMADQLTNETPTFGYLPLNPPSDQRGSNVKRENGHIR